MIDNSGYGRRCFTCGTDEKLDDYKNDPLWQVTSTKRIYNTYRCHKCREPLGVNTKVETITGYRIVSK
jgi:hypothetical protein